jgi:hypothetical protein
MNSPWGALAHLGLARAYAEQQDIPWARAAYQDFFGLWKRRRPGCPYPAASKGGVRKVTVVLPSSVNAPE